MIEQYGGSLGKDMAMLNEDVTFNALAPEHRTDDQVNAALERCGQKFLAASFIA